METPNPENIVVATCNFYLDPTHQRPIPPMLLAFVAEYAGFARVKTLRLQESKDLVEKDDISLQDVFAGASPDYAVVAQKHASDDVLALTNEAFSLDYGLSLENLLGRWDGRFGRLETKAQQAETKAQQAETKAEQAETASNERLAQLQAVYASTSWKITKPLRAIKRLLAGDFAALGRSTAAAICNSKQAFRPPVSGSCLFVDVSDIVMGDKRTGIQRVVRNILACLISAPPNGYSIYPVYALPKGQGYAQASFNFNGVSLSVRPEIERQPIEFLNGDIFFGLDFACTQVVQSVSFLKQLRSLGVKVYFVLYDLLPVRMPEAFEKEVPNWHARWLNTIAEFNGVVAISAAVADDYLKWIVENKLESTNCKISHFHLGADIDYCTETAKRITTNQEELLRQFANRMTFLMVGTIEPRKGQEQVLSAFELLWQEQADIVLIIVGKEGWKTEALINRIRLNQNLGKNLFFLPEIDDNLLENIYATSNCLIAASLSEGFGLPLIEAAQHKIPIVARDIPVFREVAGECAFYFSATTPGDLASAIRVWLGLYAKGKHPKSDAMPWLTWKQSTDSLLKQIGLAT